MINMNWKQFLKPDWKKIVVFILFFSLISYISPFLHDYIFPCVYVGPDSCMGEFYGLPLIFGVRLLAVFRLDNIIFLITDLIFWYLLSCLIVWIYDKFIKKKEDYVHIKDVNMVMGQLEKWGKKK